MDKNYEHTEHPEENHTDAYAETERQEAFELYVNEGFDDLCTASQKDIKYAWGPKSEEELEKINFEGFVTNDKEMLEKMEKKAELKEQKEKEKEKKQKEKAERSKKKREAAKLHREAKKQVRSQKKTNQGGQMPPPPNQLALNTNSSDSKFSFRLSEL